MTLPAALVTDAGGYSKQRPEAFGTRGMVASAHPLATFTGLSILERGGNAFDAAIAVAAVEGVLLPMKCGLGGDAFVVLHDARSRKMLAYNGSGVAAAGATPEHYLEQGHKTMPLHGVHAVSVPGAVSVYEALWKEHCTLPWAELWAPAIRLAEEGLIINQWVSGLIDSEADLLGRFAYSSAQFLPQGRAPRAGERWSAPDLARTLHAVARGGAETFYRGAIAEQMLAFLKSEGALFSANDFARQQAVTYEPLASTYRGLTVYETAPPSQGFLLLEQLNILEGFDLAALGLLSAERMHLLLEAKKLAFADRNRYAADPAAVDWPLQTLISKSHAKRRRAEIDLRQARQPQGALIPESGGDTSYFAVADGDGNAVSFIHSLSNSFGSGVVAGATGITLNNRAGRGFSLDRNHPNVLAPGRRTMHTLNAYLICRDGKPWLIGGTPGGDQQTQWSTQVVTGIIDHGLTLQQAADAPRWYGFPGTDIVNLGKPAEVRAEGRIPDATLQALSGLGHTVRTLGPWSSGGAVQLIAFDRERGVLRGGTDPRPGGLALGI